MMIMILMTLIRNMSIQTEAENNVRLLNDIMMTDKLVKHVSVSREKKLAKKLKN